MNELEIKFVSSKVSLRCVIHTLSRSLARPPRRSMYSASCPEMSILIPESLSFCLTNESELAVSASDSAIDCSGFDGRANRNV